MLKTEKKSLLNQVGYLTFRKRTRKPDAVNMGTCIMKYKTYTSSYYIGSKCFETDSQQENVKY